MKKDMMLNKNKLKGRDIYIDRDMTWQQRAREKCKYTTVELAGTRRLTEEDWTYIKKFEIVCLTETWSKNEDRQYVENQMPGYNCYFRDAIKVEKKGRASGGMLLAVKSSYETGGARAEEQEEIISEEGKIDKDEWKIIGSYTNKGKDRN
ncbi:hypothetical protein QAD02_013893 [Eretmocerus hayati]|uniref:Uncharacterized protein n=1 Tax=Eretmocerus hayati TaxID=131215 RepID=A0ACC2P507_9HYME|nr:hypothetical protein QAD02_013893 [Eretmocerus hayati]